MKCYNETPEEYLHRKAKRLARDIYYSKLAFGVRSNSEENYKEALEYLRRKEIENENR